MELLQKNGYRLRAPEPEDLDCTNSMHIRMRQTILADIFSERPGLKLVLV